METTFEKDNYIETGMPKNAGELFPGTIVEIREDENRRIFVCDNLCQLEVTVVDPKTIRFRFTPTGEFSDGFSYALDDQFDQSGIGVELSEKKKEYVLKTESLVINVAKVGLLIRIEDHDGFVLSQDEKGFHWYENDDFGGENVMLSRNIQPRERFYGLGDIPGHKDLRGQRRMLWGSDVYGYDAATDPLYKSIPFFIGLHHDRAYGIFFDNSFRSSFDFGEERSSVASFWAQGGEMNFYFMDGPRVTDVVSSYSRITGVPEMPPLWALGFHQCKWSYKSEDEVMAIASGFKTLEIPCDAIYVDIDYMDGFRCFTWNSAEDAYPNPRRMTEALAQDGIKTVAIIDPGIKIDPGYFVYQSGIENDVFCRRMDGPLMKGNVWPGACHFPDFTNEKVRDWWADLFPPFMEKSGLAGIWTDMNEPAVFNEDKTFPRDVRHDYDGHPCSHRKAHNVYGMQMSRATQEGLRRAAPDRRPFVITRSAYAGTQRYSSAWTGDIQSTWEHLRIGNGQCQRLSLSGYSFVGTDIGGFSGRSDGELFVRWLQMGVFHPFCRVHSSGDENEQEPWSFGDAYTAVAKKFIELRYRILPYLYTVFEEHIRLGTPMLRSLVNLDQNDSECHGRMEEFSLGADLFTCPISDPEIEGRWFYLPEGTWYDFWSDRKTTGGDEFWQDVPLEETILYVRGGRILPISPVRMNSSVPLSHMELHVYPDQDSAEGSLYEDAGEGYDYREENGSVSKEFRLEKAKEGFTLRQDRVGGFAPAYSEYHLSFHGKDIKVSQISIDGGEAVSIQPGEPVKLPEDFVEAVLS
ncbi:DUF4968 domain-containing protein [Akkermansiaceae bacterium]|nr:DUF4968 domain-containing protein [Akkermansiaceae bacterium]MDB4544315.1 DUF4968 domain-containing protein [Akkermansiaceae bacterium]